MIPTEPAGAVHPDDSRFFAPSSMVGELRRALRESGQEDTDDPVRLTKVILDSLAMRYADVVSAIERDRARVVVGPDAHVVSALARVLPGRSGLVGRLTSRLDS